MLKLGWGRGFFGQPIPYNILFPFMKKQGVHTVTEDIRDPQTTKGKHD
jgi:hypothetical protein